MAHIKLHLCFGVDLLGSENVLPVSSKKGQASLNQGGSV